MPANKNKQPCQSLTTSGRLCRVHLPASDPRRITIRPPQSLHRCCRAKILDGQPCSNNPQ